MRTAIIIVRADLRRPNQQLYGLTRRGVFPALLTLRSSVVAHAENFSHRAKLLHLPTDLFYVAKAFVACSVRPSVRLYVYVNTDTLYSACQQVTDGF